LVQEEKMATDELIKTNVTDQLFWDGRVDASEIKISVDDGTVNLEGDVNSLVAKEAASADAWQVNGVNWVNNKLNVQLAAIQSAPTDDQLESNIRNRLMWDPDISEFKLDIAVNAGNVSLEGTVNTFWKKVRAESIVMGLNGVVTVTNNLAVVPTEDFTDEAIAEDIIASMERNRWIEPDELNLTVENGEVSLTGNVPTWSAKRAAHEAALYTPGVIMVNDRLNVRS
jgi:osmotically-inducible protein OsmY